MRLVLLSVGTCAISILNALIINGGKRSDHVASLYRLTERPFALSTGARTSAFQTVPYMVFTSYGILLL